MERVASFEGQIVHCIALIEQQRRCLISPTGFQLFLCEDMIFFSMTVTTVNVHSVTDIYLMVYPSSSHCP